MIDYVDEAGHIKVDVDVVVGPRRDAYKPLARLKRLTQLAALKYMGVFQSCYLDFLPRVVGTLCVDLLWSCIGLSP